MTIPYLQNCISYPSYKEANKPGDLPFHSHPNEQSGYVISGKHILKLEGIENVLTCGDSYSIPENTPHSWEVIEAGEVLDVFSPIGEDYL